MKITLLLPSLILLLISCRSTNIGVGYDSPNVKHEFKNDTLFKIEKYSTDKLYGFSKTNPIMVGGISKGPLYERLFLNSLTGPNGEKLDYYRMNSCCLFKTKNNPNGDYGLLDVYNVSYSGLTIPLKIYINMYDSDTLKVPIGLKLEK